MRRSGGALSPERSVGDDRLGAVSGVKKEIILELTESGHFPCVLLPPNEPRYIKKCAIEYIKNHVLKIQDGKPFDVKIYAWHKDEIEKQPQNMPLELQGIDGIIELKNTYINTPPVIYFLCMGGEIVYVGQSISVFNRIVQHKDKAFDTIFAVPVPHSLLNQTEIAFIKAMKPKYNKEVFLMNYKT